MVHVGKLAALVLIYFAAAQAYRTPGQVRRFMLTACTAVVPPLTMSPPAKMRSSEV